MPKNIVPRDNDERKNIRKDDKNIEDMRKDVPQGPHQPISDVERYTRKNK